MKMNASQSFAYFICLFLVMSSCKKEEEVVVKKGTIEGAVSYFDTNDPLIDQEVFLYGRRISGPSVGNVKIATTTTDSSGNYTLNFQYTDEMDNLNIWVASAANENFSGLDVNKYNSPEYNLSGFSSCYLQGVLPNTTDVPIALNTVNHRDVLLYPFNTISFTVINDTCYDVHDAIDISIKNAMWNEFRGGITSIGNCDTLTTGTQLIVPPAIIRWKITKNNITTTHYDTLQPASCEMMEYEIHY